MAKSTKGTRDTKGSGTTEPAAQAVEKRPPAKGAAADRSAAGKAGTTKAAAKKTAAQKTAAPKRRATVEKKAASKKTAAKKAAAKRPAAKAAAAGRTALPAITGEERHRLIAEAAYLRAEAQGFGSDQHGDWLAAEAEVDARLLQQQIDVVG